MEYNDPFFFSKFKVSNFCKRESDLQRSLEEVDKRICNTPDLLTLDSELKEYDRLKCELHHLYEIRGKEAMFRSKHS